MANRRLDEQDTLMVRIAMRGPKSNARMHAMLKQHEENDARTSTMKIQPRDIEYIRKAAEAPDVLQFLAMI